MKDYVSFFVYVFVLKLLIVLLQVKRFFLKRSILRLKLDNKRLHEKISQYGG